MKKLLLADDDIDDRLFFQDAVEDLCIGSELTTVIDGVELMEFLYQNVDQLPDILFLDLNMPRTTGCECLLEIKANEKLRNIPVVIFSTSLDLGKVDELYEQGAHYYIRKPGDFTNLKRVILEATTLIAADRFNQPERNKFVIKI